MSSRLLSPAVTYAGVVGLSAYTLFTLQLFAGRLVVPIFGGSAGVWASALCFFSFALLVGYAYAHLVTSRLNARTARFLHLGVAALVLVVVLLMPAAPAVASNLALPDVVAVLAALAVVAAAPALLLSATTPLLSAWYGATGRDPWWLFAASNAASFAALLLYPLVWEPLLPLSSQRTALAGALAVLVAGMAVIAMGNARSVEQGPPPRSEPQSGSERNWRRVALWFVAAFVPAGLLAATTNFLTTDLAPAPLLWVGPLAVYLASFVVAFSERGRRILPVIDRLVPAAAVLLWLPFAAPVGWPFVPLLAVELLAFFVLATAIHGRLAGARPGVSDLTGFYLVVAAAGAAATATVAIAAPLMLPDVYEYPLLVGAGLAVVALVGSRSKAWLPDMSDRRRVAVDLAWRVVPYLLIVGVVLVLWSADSTSTGLRLFAVGLVLLAVMATPRAVALLTPLVIIATISLAPGAAGATQLFKDRSLYGVSEVVLVEGSHALYSGTTIHGVQFTDDRRDVPTTYYVEPGPLGDAFADLRARTDGADIGVIGLGSGTAAAYTREGDSLVFMEIDPLVVQIANDAELFTFLRDSAVPATTLTGDGRLSVAGLPSGSLDLLVVDAFSSGSVPPHLLTREAIADFMRALRPGGLVAFHVSNRYYDLAPAVTATAQSLGFGAAQREYLADEEAQRTIAALDSSWVVVGSASDVARMIGRGWTEPRPDGPVLTDDYHDLSRLLRP